MASDLINQAFVVNSPQTPKGQGLESFWVGECNRHQEWYPAPWGQTLPDLTCVSLSSCPSVSLDTASFAGVGKNTGGAEVDSARDCGLLGFLRSTPFKTPWMESCPPALLCPRESLALKEVDCIPVSKALTP